MAKFIEVTLHSTKPEQKVSINVDHIIKLMPMPMPDSGTYIWVAGQDQAICASETYQGLKHRFPVDDGL